MLWLITNLMCYMGPLIGASFNVNPIKVDLTPDKPLSFLQIQNVGDETIRIQVKVVEWSTDGRHEILTDTNDLLLNPPIFSVEPRKTQFLRFGVRNPKISEQEKTYRLLIDEVPQGKQKSTGIRTLLRVSIPVFIAPKTKQLLLSWHLKRDMEKTILVAVNEGNVHSHITNIQLNNTTGDDKLKINIPTYILPGQHKEWVLENEKIHDGDKVTLNVQTSNGEIKKQLILETN